MACAVDFDATLSEDLFDDAGLFVVDDAAQYRYYREQGYFGGYPGDPVELCDVLDADAPAGSCATWARESGQVRKEAALSGCRGCRR